MSVSALVLAAAGGALVLAAPWAVRAPRPGPRRRVTLGRLLRARMAATQSGTGRAAQVRDLLPAPLRALWQVLVLDAQGPTGHGLRDRLIHAGRDPARGVRWVRGFQLVFVVVFGATGLALALAGGLAAGSSAAVGALAALVGLAVPLVALSWEARTRRERFRRGLVPFLHLLAALVGTGLALQNALRQVAQGHSALADELRHALALQDTVGTSLDEALRAMAGRCASEEVTTALRRLVLTRRRSSEAQPLVEGLLQLAEATRVTLRTERRVRQGRAVLGSTIIVVLLGLPLLLVTLGYPVLAYLLQGSR